MTPLGLCAMWIDGRPLDSGASATRLDHLLREHQPAVASRLPECRKRKSRTKTRAAVSNAKSRDGSGRTAGEVLKGQNCRNMPDTRDGCNRALGTGLDGYRLGLRSDPQLWSSLLPILTRIFLSRTLEHRHIWAFEGEFPTRLLRAVSVPFTLHYVENSE